MAALLTAGRGAARLLLRRRVPAAFSRPPVLQPRFDSLPEPEEEPEKKRLWDICQEAISEPDPPRPVLPLEMRYDREQEVPILCRTGRPFYVKYAEGATGLVHSDLNKYWVPEVLQELYTEVFTSQVMAAAAATEECEFGKQMEATLQTFQKFGSLLYYHMGTCCVRDKDGGLSVVVDDNFCKAVMGNPRYCGDDSPMQATGYSLWTVSKSAFQCGAFKVETQPTWVWDIEHVEFDKDKFRVATGASEEEVRRAGQVKVAVEINRGKLDQPNLVLFMPLATAKNKFEVFLELSKVGVDVRGLQLSRSVPYSPTDLKYSLWYELYRLGEQLEIQ